MSKNRNLSLIDFLLVRQAISQTFFQSPTAAQGLEQSRELLYPQIGGKLGDILRELAIDVHLLDEKRNTVVLALIPQCSRPVWIHRAASVAGFGANYYPVPTPRYAP